MFPILNVMEPEVLNQEWLKMAAESMANLYIELEGAALAVEMCMFHSFCRKKTVTSETAGSETSTLKKPTLVSVRRMGQGGWPRKEISSNFLKESMTSSRRITFKKLAELAGVHRHTLWFYLKKHGMYQWFCDILESDLDTLVKTFKAKKPGSGLTYMIGFL
jgi:hypothetical protein